MAAKVHQPIEHPRVSGMQLTGICLPFEVKQLLREVFNMSALYVLQPEAVLKPTGFYVAMKQEDGSWKKHCPRSQLWNR